MLLLVDTNKAVLAGNSVDRFWMNILKSSMFTVP